MNVRKRKKRSDSKCPHSEEYFSRKWDDKLYCMECQKSSVKRSRERSKLKKVQDSINYGEVFFKNYA